MILQLLPVIFLKLCYFFNPKLFDTPYLQNKSQTHILAVKVLNRVISSFFLLKSYHCPECVLFIYMCFLAVAVFSSFRIPSQTFINHLLCAGAILSCVRNIKMDKTSMAVFYRLPLYSPFVKNPSFKT